MALAEARNLGIFGKEIAGSLRAGTAIVGSMAEYATKKTETTREMVKEMLWYEVRKATHRVRTRYIRPMRRWL